MANVFKLLWMLGCWAGCWYWAAAYGGRSAWICFYGMSTLLLYITLGCIGWSRPVRVERLQQQLRCWSGDPVELPVRLRFGGRVLPLGWLLVEQRWTHTGTGEPLWLRDIVTPVFSGSAEARLRVPSLPRGLYVLEASSVTASDVFGLLRIRRRIKAGRQQLLVLPKPLPLPAAAEGAGEEHPRLKPQLQRQAASPLVYGTRPYAPGDPLNRVHWRSTARAGALRAKESEQPGADRLLVCLDAAMGVPNAEAFGTAVRAAAGLAQRGLQLGLTVRLAVTDRQGRTAEARGRERLAELLELLALVPCDGDRPFAASVQREALHAGPWAGVAIVTAQPDEQLLKLAYRLRERAVHLVYVHGRGSDPAAVQQWKRQAEAVGCRFTAVTADSRYAAEGGEGYGAEAGQTAAAAGA
ncbi:hypothetical protein SK3146_03200 [Paenibacillus konkukensis]|uniref:DUF58 domain-containing protein n=1 Tax=Paenibacillus konkukensis TaxID=2020716 RepID=A0ABY4RPG9_9BACL|nr:DUF58 domain-containing protein [Paenibacillus konkukensis]UQZ83988.1 hypothetical protein SK3146_03200 [Paenibacillus konkukensis]